MSCCGACGGQDTEQNKDQEQKEKPLQKPATESPETQASVQSWDAAK